MPEVQELYLQRYVLCIECFTLCYGSKKNQHQDQKINKSIAKFLIVNGYEWYRWTLRALVRETYYVMSYVTPINRLLFMLKNK